MGHQGTLPHYVSGKVRLGGLCCRFPRWYQTVSGGAIPWSEVPPAGFIRPQKGPLAVSCIFNGDYIQDCDMLKSIMQVNISLTFHWRSDRLGNICVCVYLFFLHFKVPYETVSWRRVYFIHLHLISLTSNHEHDMHTHTHMHTRTNCDINYIAQNIK